MSSDLATVLACLDVLRADDPSPERRGGYDPTPVLDRVLGRLSVDDGPDPCWVYTGSLNPKGYAQVHVRRGVMHMAHRITYVAFVGPIPEGLVLDHLCRNPSCCNPAHLEAVTTAENTRRGRATHSDGLCVHGHPLDGRRPGGQRYCRACLRESSRRVRNRRKEGAK